MKKFVATILIMLMALTCAMAFVGCNNNDDNDDSSKEISVGAVSELTYSSIEDAVKGFLEKEISAQEYTAEFVSYTKIADLSQSEIAKLTIDEQYKVGIVAVQKGEVEYITKDKEKSYSQLMTKLAAEIAETYKRDVYVVTYEYDHDIKYRFITPTEELGQSPTASILASIFDMEKYFNCTLLFEVGLESNNGKGYKNYYKLTENAIYNTWIGENDTEDYTDESCYVMYNNAVYLVGNKIGDEKWGGVSKVGDYLSIVDYTKSLIDACYFDCWLYLLYYYTNCFEKTDTGYTLVRQIVIADLDDAIVESYNMIISNGRIANATLCINADGVKYLYSTTFSDFGTTTVDVPPKAMDAVKAYVERN